MDRKRIGPHLEVIRPLGAGAFGRVFLCRDLRLDRHVAVKMLSDGTDSAFEDASSEARRMAKLTHSNVVQVYELGQDGDHAFLVSEFIEGQTLRDVMKDRSIPLETAATIMAQVADGLRSLHEIDLVHRDLKPENIMLTVGGTAKILDLGLARNVDHRSLTDSARIAGSYLYMAPETVDGRGTGPTADVFAFGVILYEMVAGVHPFQAEHPMSVLYNILERDAARLSDHAPGLPPVIQGILDRCLVKNPAARETRLDRIQKELVGLATSAHVVALNDDSPRVLLRQANANPYSDRVMIKDPRHFFGRTREIRRIESRLLASAGGSISIFGERKIGKSSLLNFVYTTWRKRVAADDEPRLVMTYIDLQSRAAMTPTAFVETVLGLVRLELGNRVDLDDVERDLDGMRDLVARLRDAKLRLVLILDEFEVITGNENFDLKFFSFLRHLANHFDVIYLTSSARDLQTLCHADEIRDSPFFNIFTPIRLTTLELEEAVSLISGPSREAGHPLETYAEAILSFAGRFPFDLQVACSHMIEVLEEQRVTTPDVMLVESRFAEEIDPHYRALWSSLDEYEKDVLSRLAGRRSIPKALEHVADELRRRGLVVAGEDGDDVFCSTFERFVSRQNPSRRSAGRLWRWLGRSD